MSSFDDPLIFIMQIINRLDAIELKLTRLTQAVERLASLPQISIVNTGRDTANSDSSVNINDSDVITRDMVGGNKEIDRDAYDSKGDLNKK